MSDAGDATVFSRSRQVVFDKPIAKAELEELLQQIMNRMGEPLAYNGVILGHIKALARLPEENQYLFLSVTRLDQVDRKVSPEWSRRQGPIDRMELAVNALVFGHSSSEVEKIVEESLKKAGMI
ncbi:hypothetical protein [Acetonema longum]|uniref:Uncharacterized protein n=1 Tax=Acetonema longum DSM 6540 TaxID=1009370 RepID=F7NLQ7_9FIRM|nr:hypothetical protein [Acetonema longum]EGO62998.1 hypothetical protein ALO_15157 [Acetonema longum DSM 6540]